MSPALLDKPGWSRVLAATEQWPATCGALPFGFEFPLRDPQAEADFGITLVPWGETADWIRRNAEAGTAPAFICRLARLFEEMGTTLHGEIDRAMLEIDIVTSGGRASREPGVFLYFCFREPDRPDSRWRNVDAVLAALNAALGRPDDEAEFRLAKRVFRALPPGVRLIALGALPGRDRGFRLTVSGFTDGAAATAFLRRVGWNGRYDAWTKRSFDLQDVGDSAGWDSCSMCPEKAWSRRSDCICGDTRVRCRPCSTPLPEKDTLKGNCPACAPRRRVRSRYGEEPGSSRCSVASTTSNWSCPIRALNRQKPTWVGFAPEGAACRSRRAVWANQAIWRRTRFRNRPSTAASSSKVPCCATFPAFST